MSFPEPICSEAGAGRAGRLASLPVALKGRSLPLPTRIAFVGNYLPLYYGAADSSVALATGSISCLLTWLSANSSAGDGTEQ